MCPEDDGQPEAGPSRLPLSLASPTTAMALPSRVRVVGPCALGEQCPYIYSASTTPVPAALNVMPLPPARRRRRQPERRETRGWRRQAPAGSSSVTYSETTASDAASSGTPSAWNPADQPTPSSSYTFSAASSYSSLYPPYANSSYAGTLALNASSPTHTQTYFASARKSATSSPFTAPWTYKASQTTSSHAAAKTTYVPGIVLNLTLSGDSDTEAVYAVPMQFGHTSTSSDIVFPGAKRAGKSHHRRSSDSDVQTMMLQVDLGSSDLWVASEDCSTSDCSSAPSLLDTSESLDSGVAANMTYQSGSISGEIYWEEVSLGSFGIGYQAFISADNVADEGLGSGDFSGVLGLSLPENSVISENIPGTTGSNPDGATFLDNLFGAGSSAPTDRLFSLALERREDVRTASVLGIGAISDTWCPSPCDPPYSPIVAQPSLGRTGYLYWRIEIQAVTATTWEDEQSGTGSTTRNITLGPSLVDTSSAAPLAVLDSGGVQILMGSRTYANSIYSAFGVSESSDGYYRMPCTKQMSLAFTIAGQQYPIHPLDMTYADPTDASQSTCIGIIQYSSTLGDTGDFVLGSAFLKNVYSIFQYPDTSKQTIWKPTVGLVSLTNASVASQDFYAVRTLHEALSIVSSQSPMTSGTPSTGGGGTVQQSAQAAAGRKAVSSAVIAGCSVVGFFILAAGLFCAWWFWLRRKFGATGVVAYGERRPRSSDSAVHKSDISMSTLRSRKHEEAHRQKSMIEGLSDYEADSWMSTTEGNDSIRLGYLPEVIEEDEGRLSRAANGDQRSRGSRGSSLGNSSVERGGADTDDADADLIESAGLGPAGGPGPAAGAGAGTGDGAPHPQRPSAKRRGSSPLAARRVSSSGSVPTRQDVESNTGATRRDFSSPPSSRTRNGLASPATPDSDLPTPQVYTYPQGAAPRSMSFSMSGPFPAPSPHPHPHPTSRGHAVMSMGHVRPDSSPMYDIRASDYMAVPLASPPQPREGRRGSAGRGGGVGGTGAGGTGAGGTGAGGNGAGGNGAGGNGAGGHGAGGNGAGGNGAGRDESAKRGRSTAREELIGHPLEELDSEGAS